MAGVLEAAARQVRSWPRSFAFWWLLVLAPLGGTGTVWALLDTGVLRDVPVALCDQDHSALSRRLARHIGAIPSVRIARVTSSADEGKALLRRGEVYAFILIPRDFERDVLRRRPVRPLAFLEGQHMAVAGILNRDLTELGLALWRGLDSDLRERMGVPVASALSQSSTVGLDVRPIANPGSNYRPFLLPGVLAALLQLCLSIMSVNALLHLSRREGPARGVWREIAGTLLPLALWTWLVGCGLTGLLVLYGDLSLRGSFGPLAAAWLAFSLAGAALGLLIFALTKSSIQGLSVVSAFSSPAFAFAGLTFPILSMPLFGRLWAMLLPVTHMLKIMVLCGQMGSPLSAQAASFLSLGLLFAAGTACGLPLAALRVSRARRTADPLTPSPRQSPGPEKAWATRQEIRP